MGEVFQMFIFEWIVILSNSCSWLASKAKHVLISVLLFVVRYHAIIYGKKWDEMSCRWKRDRKRDGDWKSWKIWTNESRNEELEFWDKLKKHNRKFIGREKYEDDLDRSAKYFGGKRWRDNEWSRHKNEKGNTSQRVRI